MTSKQSLKTFLSETEMPAPRANLRACSLNDVLVRETPVQWDEAVAVVQELCDLLTDGGNDESLVPELAAILITADGVVKLQRGSRSEAGVAGAGRTLHALLSSANVPVGLRLFVTQSISTDAYSSIRAFADALAYFGKPGRTELIRALYERCAARVAATAATAAASVPEPVAKPEKKSTSRKKSRIPAWSAAAATVICLLGGGVWFLARAASAPAGIPSVPQLVAGAKSALQTLAAEVRNTVTGEGATASVSSEQSAANTSAPRGRRALRRDGVRPRETADSQPMTSAQAIQPQSLQVLSDEYGSSAMSDGAGNGSESQGDVMREADMAAPVIESVYSNSDLDVKPPILLYPQLPPPLLTGAHSEAMNRMELIVSANGSVERVRLINGPRRMPDMMLLSGAKVWRFEPAVRNGAPVRYRTIVAWTAVP